jgi:predicted adenylyl cyclase CyaB
MKQIEVTTYVKDTLEGASGKLASQGFTLIRKSRVEDKYMIQDLSGLNSCNIKDFLQRCLLIRHVNVLENLNGEVCEFKNFTYKKKEYDGDTVLSEEKVCVKIDNSADLSEAEKLFLILNFQKLVEVNYDVVVFEKDGVELCFQDVENLGLLLEYESLDDYQDASVDEILAAKKRMLDLIRTYQLDVSDDYDVKKAYELVKKERKF